MLPDNDKDKLAESVRMLGMAKAAMRTLVEAGDAGEALLCMRSVLNCCDLCYGTAITTEALRLVAEMKP